MAKKVFNYRTSVFQLLYVKLIPLSVCISEETGENISKNKKNREKFFILNVVDD